jgi:hypothetical protein
VIEAPHLVVVHAVGVVFQLLLLQVVTPATQGDRTE